MVECRNIYSSNVNIRRIVSLIFRYILIPELDCTMSEITLLTKMDRYNKKHSQKRSNTI